MPLGANRQKLLPGADHEQILFWRSGAPCRPSAGGVLVPEDSAVTVLYVTWDFDPTAIDETTIIRLVGTVKWGTDKDAHVVDFDIRRGVPIAVPTTDGQFLITYRKFAGSLQPELSLNAGVGRGAKSSPGVSANATLTLDVPAAPGALMIIPKTAVSAILISPTDSGAARLVQRTGASPLGAPGPVVSSVPIGQLDFEAVPIAQGALVWEVTDAPANSMVQFNLNLS